MNIASYLVNSQTAPAFAELGTAQLQLVILFYFTATTLRQAGA